MREIEFVKIAKELMEEHIGGLFYTQGWLKRGSYQCHGKCIYSRRILKFNRDFIKMASEEDIRDLILHEIAHALSYHRHGRNGAGHGYRWKQVCREIGARPDRLYEGETRLRGVVKKPLYQMVLKTTGEVVYTYYRKPSYKGIESMATRYLLGREAETLGKIELRKVA